MAIVNRDLDASQQKDVVNFRSAGAVATGASLNVCVIPYPCVLQSVNTYATGVSNAMQVAVNVQRWVSAGVTVIACGISNIVLQNYSLSGILGFSGLAAPGSTLLALQTGDVLNLVASVSNGNALELNMDFVLKKSQDIVAHNGNSA